MNSNQKKLLFVAGAVVVAGVAVSSRKPLNSTPITPSLPIKNPSESNVAPYWIKIKDEWGFILNETTQGNLAMAYLIAAIGMHETKWGTLGVGRDYIMGYGVYDKTPTGPNNDPRYKGFRNQVQGVWYEIMKFSNRKPPKNLTLAWLSEFARVEWKATDKNWANAVWAWYQKALPT